MEESLRRAIPKPVRRVVRALHRQVIFVRSLNRFRRSPTSERTSMRLLGNLAYGWGNEGFSGRPTFY
jgi:hypothetical protein